MYKAIFSCLIFLPIFTFAQQNINGQLTYQDKSRTYIIHLPTGYSSALKYPLYLCLHGNSGSSSQMMDYTNLNTIADTGKFVVVYPQGFSDSWADGRGTTDADKAGIDDVGFISSIIDSVSLRYNTNTKKVYAAGISNGGFMVQRLLCQLGNKLAAGASIAAQVINGVDYAQSCPTLCSKPVMFFHGTKDNYVPYNGGPINGENGGNGKDGYTLSVDSSMALWSRKNGCSKNIVSERIPNHVVTDFCRAEKISYTGCNGQDEVINFKIIDGGHTWPGADVTIVTGLLVGRTNQDINAGVETWNFFKTKTLINCNEPTLKRQPGQSLYSKYF